MSRNLKIAIFAAVAITVAILIGQTPDKGPYTDLQELVDKVQADPMINEFGGVDGTTVLEEGDGILDVPPSVDGKYAVLSGELNGITVPTPEKFKGINLQLLDGVIMVIPKSNKWGFFIKKKENGEYSKEVDGTDVLVKLYLNRKDPYAYVFIDYTYKPMIVKLNLIRL